MRKGINFILNNSLLLVFGAVVGLVWANAGHESYHHFVEMDFSFLRNPFFGEVQGDGLRHISFHFFVNDILMAFFFAMAGKEVWESTFPGGALHNPKTAATPLIATAGGVLGPVLVYVVGAHVFGHWGELHHGWAIPTATDIAFSAMVARLVFGWKHPAVPFLLLLAIADDAVGLVIIAVFYTQGEVQPLWLLLSAGAGLFAYFVFNRKLGIKSIWPYVALFAVSWVGFGLAGIHQSLSFIPIIVAMPHAAEDEGAFSESERGKEDTLNVYGATFFIPVEIVLFLFGFANAGVQFATVGFATYLILVSLVLGKTLGIFLFGGFSAKVLKFKLPEGMCYKDLAVLGAVAGIGFTVALFVASVAFPLDSPHRDAAKMGALLSLLSFAVAYVMAKALGVKKVK